MSISINNSELLAAYSDTVNRGITDKRRIVRGIAYRFSNYYKSKIYTLVNVNDEEGCKHYGIHYNYAFDIETVKVKNIYGECYKVWTGAFKDDIRKQAEMYRYVKNWLKSGGYYATRNQRAQNLLSC